MSHLTLDAAQSAARSALASYLSAVAALKAAESLLDDMYPELTNIEMLDPERTIIDFRLDGNVSREDEHARITSLLDVLKENSPEGADFHAYFSIGHEAAMAANADISFHQDLGYNIRLYDTPNWRDCFLDEETGSFSKAVEILFRHV